MINYTNTPACSLHNFYLTKLGFFATIQSMRRITRKVRPVRSAGQLEHYVFGSERHQHDKAAADRLRQMVFVDTATEVSKIPFPNSRELAENLVREGDQWAAVRPEEYVGRLKPYTHKRAGTYWSPKSSNGKPIIKVKTGEQVMQRNQTKALHDLYLSLPPWITEVLADATQMDDGIPIVRRVAEQAAIAAAEVLEQRTGYKALGIALHPDSRHAFGIHIQYLTVEDGQLLGRSRKEGKRGRRGVRMAGDVNCALYRFSKVREISGNWHKSVGTRDYDDIAMIDAMDAKINELFPGGDYLKGRYVDNWLASKKKTRVDLEAEVADLRKELEAKAKEAEVLNKRIEQLHEILRLTTLKTQPAVMKDVITRVDSQPSEGL